MRLSQIPFLILFTVASMRAEAPPIQGTMPEEMMPGLAVLLKTSVERSPNTVLASIAVAQSESAKLSAFSILYPSLGLSSSYQVNTQSTTASGSSSTSKGIYYSASISQPIFQWGAYKNSAEIGSIGLKIAERQYAEAYRLLATSIREQYMGLISKKIGARNESFKLKIANEELEAQKARVETGSSSQAELQGFQVAVETEQLALDRSQEEYSYARRTFAALAGVKDLDEQSIPLELPHPEYSAQMADAVLAGFISNGIESTFQSQVYQMTIKQQDLNYSIQRVRLLPKLSAAATLSYENYVQPIGGGKVEQVGLQGESYSVAANWTIFDGFATRAAKMSALASKRLIERQRQNYVDTTIDSITYMRHEVGFSSRAMALTELHTRLITDQVTRLNEDLKLGYTSQATIDTGILNQYATEYDQALARTDYLSRWTEFISLAGLDPALDNIDSRYVR